MTNNHALLLSIRPRFVSSIFAGTKTVELRRVKPRVRRGDLVVVYASGTTKGLVGAFQVSGVKASTPKGLWRLFNGGSGLTKAEFDAYFSGVETGYAIQIGKRWQLDEPVLLNSLRKRRASFRPPQSYHYWNRDDLAVIGGVAFTHGILRQSRTRSETRN